MSENIESTPTEPVVDHKMKELQIVLNQVDEDGDFVELTEEQQHDVNEKSQELIKKYRSLGRALIAKDTDSLEFLISVFIRQDENERSPAQKRAERKEQFEELMFAAITDGSPEIIEMLLRKSKNHNVELDLESKKSIPKPGSDPNRPDMRHVSAPFLAAEKDNWETVKWLIQQGHMSMDIRGNNEETLFMAAVANGQYSMADKLLSLVADQNEVLNAITVLNQQSAMHAAAQIGDRETLAYLVTRRADPAIVDTFGQLASEILPEEEEFQEDFNVLEDYREAYLAGQPFAPPGEWYLDSKGEEPVWMVEGVPDSTAEPEPVRRTMAM